MSDTDQKPGKGSNAPMGGSQNPLSPPVQELDTGSAIAFIGHPVHAMLVHFPIAFAMVVLGFDVLYWVFGDPFFARAATWAVGGGFLAGVIASLVGLAEVLLVPGIRLRGASWSHAVAALTFLAVIGANWGLRLDGTRPILPDGLFLSVLGALTVGVAGYHGGKLIFDHGVGIMVASDD